MATAAVRGELLTLYKHMLRTSGSCNDYSVRNYFVRRVREEFRKEGVQDLQETLARARSSAAQIERMVTVNNMYVDKREVSVLEKWK